ncbi:MAG: cereblon family protein, partial [Pseudomonadota bacterium]
TNKNTDSDKDSNEPPLHLSWDEMDHLSYLKRHSIFENDDHDQMGETTLICASCSHPVTKVSEKTDALGRHDHAFSYYREIVRLGCFRNAPGCLGVERISHGYSWFRGYAWQIQVCRNCFTQLGWKYISPDDSFYGLIFNTLREEKPGEESGRLS